ncbi:adenylate cyclase type 8-like [Pecten maximus]|uniref:adenylate cyclase type 8-like n=1 Tax=Pecten maximus TaxID=6579 RepID=UPI001458CF2F|nr:adenylate cyclase type 8-like [Pecten maximus]
MMNVELTSVGVPTTRFRSLDTLDHSIESERPFRFDLTKYYNVCRFQRDSITFQRFVQSNIVVLLDILPVMGIFYNICILADIYLRCDSCFKDIFLSIHLIAAILHCILLGLLVIGNIRSKLPLIYPLFPITILVVVILWDGSTYLTGYALLWIQLLFFLAMMTFPGPFILSLSICLILMTCFLTIHGINPYAQNQQWKQITTSVIVFLSMMCHGFAAHFSLENEYLMDFLENLRFSKYEKIVSEEQAVKNKIMEASFPRHIAEEITRAFDSNTIGAFRKMYISKSDNVTIVFADIVGFTTISSFYTAERLVNILNDIFVAFDRIADKYHQLRLKILGDCYYYICGIPEPQEDHAYLSVCMGFGIVNAIRTISTKVSMRVGIHSGSVLSGILGLTQWQFDVLGQDVKIANLMESSGIPGKVHVTHVTLALLSNDYVITPSKAGEKVEFLKRVGIRTYFIAQTHNHQETETEEETSAVVQDKDKDRSTISDIRSSSNEPIDWNPLSLRFRDIDMEDMFQFRRQFLSLQPYAYVFAMMVFFANNSFSSFTCWKSILSIVLGSTILLFNILTMTEGIDGLVEKTLMVHLLENILICISGMILLVVCVGKDVWTSQNETTPLCNATVDLQPDMTSPVTYFMPEYVLLQFLLLIIGINEALTFRHTVKCVIMVFFALSLLALLLYSHPRENGIDTAIDMSLPAITVTSLLIFIILLDRKVEMLKRKTFLRRSETINSHAKLRKLRRKNKTLLYNLVLPDIARDLLYDHDKTYALSRTHDDVGVMFAACPHFEEFYTENCNYEDGLGCLRFLNEIISDYDELMQEPEFVSLCKIKTIGSTYMVASGLRRHLGDSSMEESGNCRRKEHLGTLVKFALKMMDVLKDISKESFTNFQLRIGINHGPVIAGVIGAHKPHYDIFGNTVNVASRMESTGFIGKIQVLKSTALILQRLDYNFKLRGSIEVKGKGRLVTYFLSRADKPIPSSEEESYSSDGAF